MDGRAVSGVRAKGDDLAGARCLTVHAIFGFRTLRHGGIHLTRTLRSLISRPTPRGTGSLSKGGRSVASGGADGSSDEQIGPSSFRANAVTNLATLATYVVTGPIKAVTNKCLTSELLNAGALGDNVSTVTKLVFRGRGVAKRVSRGVRR